MLRGFWRSNWNWTIKFWRGRRCFPRFRGLRIIWDIEFVFTGEREHVDAHPAWKKLAFVDLNAVRNEEMARYHEDILAHLGKWDYR